MIIYKEAIYSGKKVKSASEEKIDHGVSSISKVKMINNNLKVTKEFGNNFKMHVKLIYKNKSVA